VSLGELFTLLGFLTGGAVLWFEARRRKLLTEGMRLVAVVGLTAGVLGARLVEWASTGDLWTRPTFLLDPHSGGKSLLGGVFAGWLAVVLTKRRLGIRRGTGDLWALALPAGEAVGRIGCYFNQCCYGLPCSQSVPLAMWEHGAWRYPTQIWSGLTALVIFCVLRGLRDQMPREGDLWKAYLVLFGLTRFVIEFYRERPIVWHGLSAMQLVCVETVPTVIGLTLLTRYRPVRGAPSVSAEALSA